jgi:hypothetical protein
MTRSMRSAAATVSPGSTRPPRRSAPSSRAAAGSGWPCLRRWLCLGRGFRSAAPNPTHAGPLTHYPERLIAGSTPSARLYPHSEHQTTFCVCGVAASTGVGCQDWTHRRSPRPRRALRVIRRTAQPSSSALRYERRWVAARTASKGEARETLPRALASGNQKGASGRSRECSTDPCQEAWTVPGRSPTRLQ